MRVSRGRLFEQMAHDTGTIFAKKQTTFGVELKMGTGVVLYPKRRMARGRGSGIRFVKGFSGFSAEKKEKEQSLHNLLIERVIHEDKKEASQRGRLCVGTKKWWTARAIFSTNSFMLKYLQCISDTQNNPQKSKNIDPSFVFKTHVNICDSEYKNVYS